MPPEPGARSGEPPVPPLLRLGPFGGRQLVVRMGVGAGRGVHLMQRVDGETGGAQDADPCAVIRVELHPTAGGWQAMGLALRSLQAFPGQAGCLRQAQGDQDAGGVEDQLPAGA